MTQSRPQPARPTTAMTWILLVTAACLGCHRQYYRLQADGEAHALMAEKASHVARPPNVPIRIEVDRRSRMFNPFDLDFQPMPLDDPASNAYMQCVDGRRGYPMWEAAGITNTAENPDWWQFLPLDDDGVLVLNSENAVRIALLHSPEYQREREELYLAALAVSSERFFFDTQFFSSPGAFLGIRRDSTEIGFANARTGGTTDLLRMRRRFAAGSELVVNLANRLVWELSGPNSQSATSVLDFSLVQPLLRNAGRDKILEGLTQSERTLLARVRAFERFRRTFYLNVTVGARIEFTAQSAVGAVTISPTGFGTTGGGAGGFLGLLQNQLEIRNSEENIARLRESTLLLEDQLIEQLTTIPDDAGAIVRQRLNVAQSRQSLVSSQQRLVNQQAAFQRSVDQFLRVLGLPPYICVRLEDPFLDQFELVDRALLTRREQLSALRSDAGKINVSILEGGEFVLDPDTGLPVSQMQWTPELAQTLKQLRSQIEPLGAFLEDLQSQDLAVIEDDIRKLAESLPERRAQSESLLQLYRTEQDSICGLLNVSEIDESILRVDQLDTLSDELTDDFQALSERLELYKERIRDLDKAFDSIDSEGASTDPRELARRLRDDIILASQDLVAELGEDVLSLQLIQAQARTESVVLPQVDIDPAVALEIARNNRRDWANARAALVDSWRAIEVSADDLESTLDVVFNGDVQNVGNNPFKLRSRTGSLRIGLQWDAPLTRILERNDYRATLIRFEQDKRTFYGFEDSVWQLLRSEIRQLQANRLTFELGRELIRNSAAQIELNADERALREARGQNVNANAARDQVQALSALLNAQNGLLGIFVNYEIVRRSLDLDLGTMELTPEGLWIDPGELSPETLLALPGTTVDGMIECGCRDCGLSYHALPPEPKFNNPLIQIGYNDPSTDIPMDAAIEAAEGVEPIPFQDDFEQAPAAIEELPEVAGEALGEGLIESP